MIKRREFVAGAATLAASSMFAPRVLAQESGLRIGALNAVTGGGSQYGTGMQAMLKAVAGIISEQGGVWGRPIECFAEDTQTRPEASVLAAKKLVEVNKVHAILGTFTSSETMAALTSVTDPAGVIHMSVAGAAEFTASGSGLAWRFTPSSYAYGVIYAKIAAESGFKKVAILGLNNSTATAQIAGFTDRWTAMGNSVAASVIYEPNRPSYRSEIQSVLAAQPDAIVCASYITDLTSILREWYQTGVPTKFIVPFWAVGDQLISAFDKEVVEDMNLVSALAAEGSPAVEAFDALYRELTGDPGSANNYAAVCYDMMNVIALAAEAAGPGADIAQINAKIREITNEPGKAVYSFAGGIAAMKEGPINYSGAFSETDFDEMGENEGSLFSWQKIKDGQIVANGNFDLS